MGELLHLRVTNEAPGLRATTRVLEPSVNGTSASELTLMPLLVMEHVAKSFGVVRALSDGSIELYRGETHALVGENGAGKSTMVKILAGVYQPDAGALCIDGHEVVIWRVRLPLVTAA